MSKIVIKIDENFCYTIKQKKRYENEYAIMELYWNDGEPPSPSNNISNLLPFYDPDLGGSIVGCKIDNPMKIVTLIREYFSKTATITSNARYKDLIQGCRKLCNSRVGREPKPEQLINRLDSGTVDILIIHDHTDKAPKSATYLFNVPTSEEFFLTPIQYHEELREPNSLNKNNKFSSPYNAAADDK